MGKENLLVDFDFNELGTSSTKKIYRKKSVSNANDEISPKSIKSKSEKTESKKSKEEHGLIDLAYVNEINYTHKPGKLTIEINYNPNSIPEDEMGKNVQNFNQGLLLNLKEFLNQIK